MANLELYGTAGCPYTSEMREWLEWKGLEFVEYDIERDPQAHERLRMIAQPPLSVPTLLENGKVLQIGWQGRSCFVS
jgi:glutaredoxin 3